MSLYIKSSIELRIPHRLCTGLLVYTELYDTCVATWHVYIYYSALEASRPTQLTNPMQQNPLSANTSSSASQGTARLM
jgi:hypothetical protein